MLEKNDEVYESNTFYSEQSILKLTNLDAQVLASCVLRRIYKVPIKYINLFV